MLIPPPERACGITILPIKQRELGQPTEKDLPLIGVRDHWTGEGKEWREKEEVSPICRLNEGLSGQTYRIKAGMVEWEVEWEVVCGDWRKGELLVIIRSLSRTPAPHSPPPEGSHPCCVYHSPPMDSIKSDRNKRENCVPPLSCIYLRLSLLTSALHVCERNKLYSWLSLNVFIIKSCSLIWNKRKFFICSLLS